MPGYGAAQLLQLLWLFSGRELAFEPEQGVFQAEHELLPLVPFFLAKARNLKLQSYDQSTQVVEFLTQASDFSLFS